ncbi:MAG: Maf family protein [Candidatus Cloacimonadaceae bacterium]
MDKPDGWIMLNELLKDRKLVLASASPRRREIFQMLGLNPLIIPADIHEPLDERPPRLIVKSHALHKAETVRKHFNAETVIVAADTLVQVDGLILGKPQSLNEAESFLSLLSGKSHQVYTGICILYKNRRLTEFAKSRVTFKQLTANEISSYIKTKEPLDKAGAYGIQGYGSQFITGISGCYFNVMGFPVNLFYTMLQSIIED